MDPGGQASSACNACRRSVLEAGWALTKDVSAASPKTAGAICRQASQSMQVESTKKSPGTFSGTRFLEFAMTGPPLLHSTGTGPALTPRPFRPSATGDGPSVRPGQLALDLLAFERTDLDRA